MKPFLLRIALVSVGMAVVGAGIRIARWAFTAHEYTDVSIDEPITIPATQSCYPGQSIEISQTKLSGASFFPEGLPQFVRESFSKHLRAMKEPSLLSTDRPEEVYRFLWLRSFHHPVAVRVWRNGEQYSLSATELSGAGGSQPGAELKKRSRRITPEEWTTFTRLLEEACFWDYVEDHAARGVDGAEWILEGVKEGRYHVTDVWAPTTGSYHDACLYLLKIAELGIDEKSKDTY